MQHSKGIPTGQANDNNYINTSFFCCVGVMYSGKYDACDVTLSVNIHTGQA